MEQILVAIAIATYNHGKYIEECLNSILSQKTNFKYCCFVGDDASTDNTQNILSNYEGKHRDKIKLFLRQTNNLSLNSQTIHQACFNSEAKYIALIDGDDYWTDPYKLQKQVDFLEANPDFTICFHKVAILKDGVLEDDYITTVPAKVTTIKDLIPNNYIHTCSCVFRKSFAQLPEWFHKCSAGDYVLHLLNAAHGKINYLPEVMGVYRVHSNSIWSSKGQLKKLELWIKMQDILIGQFDAEINELIMQHQLNLLVRYFDLTKSIKEQEENAFIDYIPKSFYRLPAYYEKVIDTYKKSTSYRIGNSLARPLRNVIDYFKKIR